MAKSRGITIKLEGVESLSKFLESQNDKILNEVENVMAQHAERQLADARSRINSISGETAKSLRVISVWKGKKTTGCMVGPDPNSLPAIIRARSLEYGHAAKNNKGGTKIVPAHPYLRPAFESDKRKAKADIKTTVQKIIDEFNRGS
jgi:hypothetical protein